MFKIAVNASITDNILPVIAKSPPTTASSQPRLTKWQLQRTAQRLLPGERVAFCMRRMQSSTVDIHYSPQYQSAHYQGLMVCGSVWTCPLCAAKIAERRRKELEQAIAQCTNNGGAVYLATYTVSHNRYDTLSTLLQSFLAARRRTKQGRAAQKMRKQFGIIGTVSVREVTWSETNGWHPHCHELVFFEKEIDISAYEAELRERWYNSAEQEGLTMNEHGFKLDRTYGAVADYVAKFGREPAQTPWGASTELTKGHLKRGRQQEHLTPFGLLEYIAQGQEELEATFKEYVGCFKGKHQLVWSAGLRALLLVSEEEKSDEELAQETEEETILLGQLGQEQWRMVLHNNARESLLAIASKGIWQLVTDFLENIGTNRYDDILGNRLRQLLPAPDVGYDVAPALEAAFVETVTRGCLA